MDRSASPGPGTIKLLNLPLCLTLSASSYGQKPEIADDLAASEVVRKIGAVVFGATRCPKSAWRPTASIRHEMSTLTGAPPRRVYLLVRAQIPNLDLRVGARGGHVLAVWIHRHRTNGTR